MACSFFPSLLDVAVFEITFSANLFFNWGRGRGKSIGPFIKQLTGSSRHLLVPVLADAGNGPINHSCSHWAGLYVSSTIFHQVW